MDLSDDYTVDMYLNLTIQAAAVVCNAESDSDSDFDLDSILNKWGGVAPHTARLQTKSVDLMKHMIVLFVITSPVLNPHTMKRISREDFACLALFLPCCMALL